MKKRLTVCLPMLASAFLFVAGCSEKRSVAPPASPSVPAVDEAGEQQPEHDQAASEAAAAESGSGSGL